MKRLELTEMERNALKVPLEQLQPGATKGFTVKELRSALKICTALEQSSGVVEIEDADWTFLKRRFDTYDGWMPDPEARAVILSLADKMEAAD